jgi:predicted nucleic acid-binding protein
MNTFALDTNIISYLLRGNPAISTQLARENDAGAVFTIPLFVYYG